ncbi:response regulator transcription factor [Actinoplanes friuliensis]|uniref:response regulator transcription factor n=1 Tax=Actinoplanes friuliensis TaxID=196914 RepID=UPI000423E7B7|nr:response regulator transcription factor [Actinoplanes friuliensis]
MCAYLLVAEDDRGQAEVLRRYLVAEGHETAVVHDGRTALERVRQRAPHLLVLDVMMPGLDGLSLCRILRRESDVPILMLTARSSENDLLTGLDLGADDYLTKPYSPRELLARTRALLRRSRGSTPVLTIGRIVVDTTRHEVSADGRPVECTPGEFALLAAMAAQPDRVFTRAQLLQHTNGVERDSIERTIDVHVLNLRRKIEPNPRRPSRLLTVYGLGYKLTAGPG